MFTGAAALTLAQPVITGNDEDKVKHVQGENVNVNVYIYIYTILNVPRILPAELSVALLVIHMVPPQEPHRKLISETGQKAMKVEKFPLRVSEELNCLCSTCNTFSQMYCIFSIGAGSDVLQGFKCITTRTDILCVSFIVTVHSEVWVVDFLHGHFSTVSRDYIYHIFSIRSDSESLC